MDKKLGGIYSITSKANGKRYIGSAVTFHKRWYNHLRELKTGVHHSKHLQSHYNKYGLDDLVFTIVETIDRDLENVTIEDYRGRLMKAEQVYLDNWDCCEFNCRKVAGYSGSKAGVRQEKSKYYSYFKHTKRYSTAYTIDGVYTRLSYHILEADAIKEVEYIKTLTNEQLIDYRDQCKAKPRKPKTGGKHCYHDEKRSKWIVRFVIAGKHIYFGVFDTEEDTIPEVAHLKTLTDVQKLAYKAAKKEVPLPVSIEQPALHPNYTYKPSLDMWIVVDHHIGKKRIYGYFYTEKEAINKVADLTQKGII